MKKLVLFATIFAAVALTACNQKKEAPATESAVEEKIETVIESDSTDPIQEDVLEEVPAETATDEAAPAQ